MIPSNQPERRLSNFEVEEKAAQAQTILNDPVFQGAYDDVYSKAIQALLNADVGSLTASAAHASIKAIVAIRNQLEEYISDDKVRKKFNTGD